MIQNIEKKIRGIAGNKWTPPILLLFIGLTIGIIISDDYGLSVDENINYRYVDHVLEMYAGTRDTEDTFSRKQYYGPVFNLTAEAGAELIARVHPSIELFDARHFMYYTPFLLGVLALYSLSLRFVSRWTAFLTSMLFYTQPMIFGHAFINPKDIPFMGFTLISIAAGFRAVDIIGRVLSNPAPGKSHLEMNESDGAKAIEERSSSHRSWKSALILGAAACVLLYLDMQFFHLFEKLAVQKLSAAYNGTSGAVITRLFEAIASDAYKTPLAAYQDKVKTGFMILRWITIFLNYFLIVPLIARFTLPGKKTLQEYLWLSLAVTSLGYVTSIRIFGLFSGAVVGLYTLIHLKKRGILPVFIYGTTALLFTYLTWPFLWKAPLSNLYEALTVMSSFKWNGDILYAGNIISDSSRPWHYVPWLLMIQLSLPAVLLSLMGIFRLFIYPSTIKQKPELLLMLGWFSFPLAGSFLPSSRLYDNIRQLLFIIPPLFVLGAPILQNLLDRISSRYWKALLILIIIGLPIPDLFLLHPYQYIYYNELVGKVPGAYQKYELDYWHTASRDAMEYINSTAPQNAIIGYPKYSHLYTPLLRDDLVLSNVRPNGSPIDEKPEFSFYPLRHSSFFNQQEYRDQIIYTVERMKVPLMHILEW